MRAVDSHAHIHFDVFDGNRDILLKDSAKNGIIGIIDIAISAEDYDKAKMKLSRYFLGDTRPKIYLSLGLAPQLIEHVNIDRFMDYAKKYVREYLAIGECGLDYYWITKEDLIKKMERTFVDIVELTKKLKKSLIIHARTAHHRNAYQKISEILLQYGFSENVVFHSFFGSKKDLRRILENGWYVGIPTIYVRKKFYLEVIRDYKDDLIGNILVETDSPYLSPYRGETNTPKNVVLLINRLAEFLSIDADFLANRLLSNTIEAFRISDLNINNTS